jgi:hypothetical protein
MTLNMVPHIYKRTHFITYNRDIFDTLYPKADGVLGTQNVGSVDWEGGLECIGTLKNW